MWAASFSSAAAAIELLDRCACGSNALAALPCSCSPAPAAAGLSESAGSSPSLSNRHRIRGKISLGFEGGNTSCSQAHRNPVQPLGAGPITAHSLTIATTQVTIPVSWYRRTNNLAAELPMQKAHPCGKRAAVAVTSEGRAQSATLVCCPTCHVRASTPGRLIALHAVTTACRRADLFDWQKVKAVAGACVVARRHPNVTSPSQYHAQPRIEKQHALAQLTWLVELTCVERINKPWLPRSTWHILLGEANTHDCPHWACRVPSAFETLGWDHSSCTAWLDCSSGLEPRRRGGCKPLEIRWRMTKHGVTERARSPVQSNRSAAKHAWDVGVSLCGWILHCCRSLSRPTGTGTIFANGRGS
jgi:hypothetical protein